MNRRILFCVGGALPVLMCGALALPVLAQERTGNFGTPGQNASKFAPTVPSNPDAGADALGTDAGGVDSGAPIVDPLATTAGTPAAPAAPSVSAAAVAAQAASPPKQQPLEAGADTETGLKGHVYDAKTKQPMPIAPVLVKGGGKTRTALTDEQGGYRLFLPPGTYSVMSYYDLYHGARIKGAKVTRGKLLNLNLLLFPLDENEEVSIQEFEIAYRADTTSAAAQDQLRLASSSIGEGFGSKQMSQVGASDAGGAAARVVGVQVEDNQLVVRGLGGRYTRVLLNGVPVPSTDPDLPGADLDLFPTSVIDSLNISKTFLPNNPADFAGGLMEIKSVQFPRQFTFQLQLGSGYRTQGTFRQALTYEGGKYDYLGFDDGRRSLPSAIPRDAPVVISRMGRYQTFEDVDNAARSFRNSWSYKRTTALPPIGLSLNVGNSHKFGNGSRVGYVASAGYDYELVRKTGTSAPRPGIIADGTLVPVNQYKLESGTEEIGLTGFGTASLDLGPDNSFTAVALANRNTSDDTQLRQGRSESVGGYVEDWQLEFLSRSLLFNQLLGDHRNIAGTRLRLRWVAFQSSGSRKSPDRRTFLRSEKQDKLFWTGRPGSGERFFTDLDQGDIGASTSLRFPLWPEGWGTVGGWLQSTSRDFSNRRFRFSRSGSGAIDDDYAVPPEELFSPTGIGRLTRLSEATFDTDSYKSSQSLKAAYALLETPVAGPLSFAGGLRVEIFPQKMDVNSPFGAIEPDPTRVTSIDRTDTNYLPGGNLKYTLSPTMILRAAYGVTVSRPMARELAPFQFYDFLRDRSIEGNPLLKSAVIRNADLRWEWFFGEGQVLAFSAFYKTFKDPIELVILNAEYQSQFRNGKEATNFGGEAELRLNLGRFSPKLKYLDFDTNVSLIRSEIKLNQEDAGAVAGTRRLFGQAPYLVNAGLRLHTPDTRMSAALVYNVVGPRITDVGIRAADLIMPNVEEQPFHSLDTISSWQFSEHMKIKLRVRNILLQTVRLRQGNLELQRVHPGLSASISLAYEH